MTIDGNGIKTSPDEGRTYPETNSNKTQAQKIGNETTCKGVNKTKKKEENHCHSCAGRDEEGFVEEH
jgi:hypothetical protein